jgi:hypothetical protein
MFVFIHINYAAINTTTCSCRNFGQILVSTQAARGNAIDVAASCSHVRRLVHYHFNVAGFRGFMGAVL